MKSDPVPCNGCIKCCQNQIVALTKQDRVSNYECERREGHWVLPLKPNGDCIYLDREKGCTIYYKRPAMCRSFDCRRVAADPVLAQISSPRIVKRGQELLDGKP